MDRFGEVVFSSSNPADKWDGTYKGVTCNLGTYRYYLRFEGSRKRPYTMKGNITMIR